MLSSDENIHISIGGPKFAVGQPLWSKYRCCMVRPICSVWDNEWIYLCVTGDGEECEEFEHELKRVVFNKYPRIMKNYLVLMHGGKA